MIIMYYEAIHTLIKSAAAAQGVTIVTLVQSHGIRQSTYYRHLKQGTPWKLKDIEALADITHKSTAEIIDLIKR